jgi:hypothetical protein
MDWGKTDELKPSHAKTDKKERQQPRRLREPTIDLRSSKALKLKQ